MPSRCSGVCPIAAESVLAVAGVARDCADLLTKYPYGIARRKPPSAGPSGLGNAI